MKKGAQEVSHSIFAGAPLNSLYFVELCAGCARLSASMAARGFKVLAVDHVHNRHKQCHQTVNIDLTNDEAVAYLATLLKTPGATFMLHSAPPCGTASRARERRLKKALKKALQKKGAREPKPLRSSLYPEGLPNLGPTDAKRVKASNNIYRNIVKLTEIVLEAGGYVCMENPLRSYLWETKWFLRLQKKFGLFAVNFQQCMHGGRRDKWSTFYTNADWLQCLALSCDNSHSHAPWGVTFEGGRYRFNTSEEAEYPSLLCSRYSDAALQAALERKVQQDINTITKKRKHDQRNMAAAGRQPRGNRHPELIPEFKECRHVAWPFSPPQKLPRCLTSYEASYFDLPAATKVLSCLSGVKQDDSKDSWVAKLGVFHEPESFIKAACELSHPFDDSSMLDDDIKRNIFKLLTEGPEEVSKMRMQALEYYRDRKAALAECEARIHHHLPQHRAKLVEDKAFLLFREMCNDSGIGDSNLFHLQISGAALTGDSCECNLFPPDDGEPAMSDEQLMRSSKWTKRMIAGKKPVGAEADEITKRVWNITLEEAQKGWLEGPLTEESIVEKYGPLFVASPRFGLVQSDKTRPIDDMSISLVNSAFNAKFKLDLAGVDGIAVLCRSWIEAVAEDRSVTFTLSTGATLRGFLHHTLTVVEAKTLAGRTLDLEAAYKQLLVKESSLWASVLAVPDDQGVQRFFVSHVLPFGASSAVYHFNMMARSLHIIGVRLFGLIWENYYDDYPQLDLAKCGGSSQHVAEEMLALLGWRFSVKESKRLPMSDTFTALGVEFGLSRCPEGLVVVRNKTSRAEQIVAEVDSILATEVFSSAAANSLRGRLQFAESQTFGRSIALRMRNCFRRASGALPGALVDQAMREELEWAKNFVCNARPRLLQAGVSKEKVLIFTDAALEDNDSVGSIGMFMLRFRAGTCIEKKFFAEVVPKDVLERLQHKTVKVISALELLAAVCAVDILQDSLGLSRTFIFIDNEAARACMISMYSPVQTHAAMLRKLSDIYADRSLFVWISRVPSVSNPADEPSRMRYEDLVHQGFTRMYPSWNVVD